MKYTNRHGAIWSIVDRIQTAPDMRKTIHHDKETYHRDRDLKNAFRL